MTHTTLETLNAAAPGDFVRLLDGVFEHAPWVAAGAMALRPFPTVAGLHDGLMSVARQASPEVRRAFLNGHPELSAGQLPPGLTPASQAEQAGVGLASATELAAMNAEYRDRFGIPFIICVRRHTGADILRHLIRRLRSTRAAEEDAAMAEVAHISRLRLIDRVCGPGAPRVVGSLATEALDASTCRAVDGLGFSLAMEGVEVGTWTTDAIAAPVLSGAPLRMGHYELRFQAGAYYGARGVPCLHDVLPVRFVVADAETDHRVSLLLDPAGYTVRYDR